MSLTVYALPAGTTYCRLETTMVVGGYHFENIDKRELLPYGYDENFKFPDGTVGPGVGLLNGFWYIDGAKQKIVVDTSFDSVEHIMSCFKKRGVEQLFTRKPEEEIVNALKKVNVTPKDIDIVILSHLHFDHFGNTELFENATFIVQKDEIPLALTPPNYVMWYYPEMTPHLTNIIGRVEAIDGDVKVADGIQVWKLGGHTPGCQAVVVDTDIGRVGLIMDNANSYVNLKFKWPGGVFFSIMDVIKGYQRMERECDVVVPGHDWEVMERYPGGKIG